jgi:hypothetical protein
VRVADLQQHLADLTRLLESSGAKVVATDLAAIRDGLAPFRDLPLKEFAGFLARAEAYSRGEVPVAAPKGARDTRKPAAGAKLKAPTLDANAVCVEIRDLYERAASPAVSAEHIEVACGRAGNLSKPGVLAIAEAVGLKGLKSKTKDAILDAIRQRIFGRKGGTIRAGLTDRAPSGVASTAAPHAQTASEFQ